jgi:hypothetical protein
MPGRCQLHGSVTLGGNPEREGQGSLVWNKEDQWETSDRADVVETRTAPPPLPSGNTVNLGSSVPGTGLGAVNVTVL